MSSRSVNNILTSLCVILVVTLPAISVYRVFAIGFFEDGFETGDFSKWSYVNYMSGGPSVASGDAHHGTYKAVFNGSGQYIQYRFTAAPVDRCFMRACVMFKSFPTSGYDCAILGVYHYGGYYMSEAKVGNVSGTAKWELRYYNNGASYTAVSQQQQPILNRWYCVEVYGKSNSASGSESRIYIDGSELNDISQTGKNNTQQITCAYIWTNFGVTQWYDCVVVDTSYIGPECALSVNVVGSGSVVKNPDQTIYRWGTNVTLTANPAAGWSFDHWSGDASGMANPITVNMTSNKIVTATFTQNTYTLTVSVDPEGSGSVSMNNTGPHHYGDVVELTAVPNVGWSFDHWSGDLAGSTNPTTILINDNKEVNATFTQNEYTLHTSVVGSGIISLNNTGPYHYGDIVELTTIPCIGWSFGYWSGDLEGSLNPATIVIDGNKDVTATFTQNTYTLTVNTMGSGSVNLNNTGPNYYGDVVELTAVPSTGWSFAHWSGDMAGSMNPETILMTGDKDVTATFTRNTYTLTVNTVGSGLVNLNNTGPYYYGDTIELTAVPSVGWSFDQWSGDLGDSLNPTTIVIDDDKDVTATFNRNMYTLAVNTLGSGSVNLNNTGAYYYGDAVELTALPSIGWSFDHWSGDLMGSANPDTILMAGNKDVTATFIQNTYMLAMNTMGSGSVDLNNTGPYYYGDVVELTPLPSVGWSFDQWSGDLEGSLNPATIVIDGDKDVTATFSQNTYTLTVSTVGSGIVNLNNTGPYHYSDAVELTAVPSVGWTFDHWSGDLLGSDNPAVLVITRDLSVTAHFSETFIHDVAVANLTGGKNIISKGYTANFTVTVENNGGYPETFDVRLYANMTTTGNVTMIVTKTVSLSNGTSTLLKFTWNVTGFAYGNYTLFASAAQVLDETDSDNNNFTYGLVKVTIAGDVDGDFTMTMGDINLLLDGFGATLAPDGKYWSHPPCIICPHSPNCDIDNNGRIDMGDINYSLNNFGKHYP